MSSSGTLADDVEGALSEDYHVEIASLSEQGQQQVYDAIQDQGGPDHADADEAIREAQDADWHRDRVEELHQEQAEAVAKGDYAQANDLAHQGEYEIRAVQADGGEGDKELVQAWKDEQNTSDAVYHQQLAADDAQFAAHDAAMGNTVAAEDAAEHAAEHESTADSLAGHADQGGVEADHSYSSESSVEETSE